MSLGEIVEFVFGLAMFAFMIFITISVFVGLVSDSKTPRRRRRRKPTYKKYKSYSYTPKDFEYFHTYNKTEFYVYFIENDKTLSPSESKDIEEKLDKLIRNMVNSHIFVENYQNIKLNFVSESLSNYMHKHYNI